MNILIKNRTVNFKEVKYVDLFELVKKSNFKHNLETLDFSDSMFNFNNNRIHSNDIQYANFDQLINLNEDIERTRRIYKRIQEYIPKKILEIKSDQRTLDKQSFRLSKQQYKKSNELIKNKLKKYINQSKEYKTELDSRIRHIYKIYTYLIPSLYVIKRPSYGIVQCKWKFMGIIQKQIHLGTFKKVGFLDDETLKEMGVEKINKNYDDLFNNLSYKNIIKEKNKLIKWCNDINYRSKK